MKQVVIGNRDIVCAINVDNGNTHIRMRLLKLPTSCYGQNRGAKNYRDKIEIIHDIHPNVGRKHHPLFRVVRNADPPFFNFCCFLHQNIVEYI